MKYGLRKLKCNQRSAANDNRMCLFVLSRTFSLHFFFLDIFERPPPTQNKI